MHENHLFLIEKDKGSRLGDKTKLELVLIVHRQNINTKHKTQIAHIVKKATKKSCFWIILIEYNVNNANSVQFRPWLIGTKWIHVKLYTSLEPTFPLDQHLIDLNDFIFIMFAVDIGPQGTNHNVFSELLKNPTVRRPGPIFHLFTVNINYNITVFLQHFSETLLSKQHQSQTAYNTQTVSNMCQKTQKVNPYFDQCQLKAPNYFQDATDCRRVQ